MSMSGEDIQLRDPNTPRRARWRLRLRRFTRYWTGTVIALIGVTVIALAIVWFVFVGFPSGVYWAAGV